MVTRNVIVTTALIAAVGIGAGIGIDRLVRSDGRPATSASAPATAAATAATAARPTGHSPKRYLFSQDAVAGTLTGPDDDHLTLELAGVRGSITRFTDRPQRTAQTVDVRDFLARWAARYATDPPNAVLSFRLPGQAAPQDIVLELTNPRYDRAAASARYDARRITVTADALPGVRHPLKPIAIATPNRFEAASLFIDDSDDTVNVMVKFGADYKYVWRPDLSQCAGYGSVGLAGFDPANLSYESYSDHSCFFRPTRARFDVYNTNPLISADGNPVKFGTVTFSGLGFISDCDGQLECDCGERDENDYVWLAFGSPPVGCNPEAFPDVRR